MSLNPSAVPRCPAKVPPAGLDAVELPSGNDKLWPQRFGHQKGSLSDSSVRQAPLNIPYRFRCFKTRHEHGCLFRRIGHASWASDLGHSIRIVFKNVDARQMPELDLDQ